MIAQITQEEEERYATLQLMALYFAREGNTRELELMLSHGMNSNLCTHKEDSLLMLATYNGNYETSKMLLKYGADIQKINQRGQTPLEGVCFKGNLDIVKLLVRSGANTEGKALTYATIFGNKDVVKFLKEEGANNSKNKLFGISVELIVSATSQLKKIFLREKKLVSI